MIVPVEWAPGYFVSSDGFALSEKRGSQKKLRSSLVNGYPQVVLTVEGERCQRKIHTIVCEAFQGPRPEGMQCRHLDGDRLNNAAGNLRWGTAKENADDRQRHRGSYPRPRVPIEVAREAIRAYASGEGTQWQIGNRLGVSREWVNRAVNGKMRRMDNDHL